MVGIGLTPPMMGLWMVGAAGETAGVAGAAAGVTGAAAAPMTGLWMTGAGFATPMTGLWMRGFGPAAAAAGLGAATCRGFGALFRPIGSVGGTYSAKGTALGLGAIICFAMLEAVALRAMCGGITNVSPVRGLRIFRAFRSTTSSLQIPGMINPSIAASR